VDSAAGTATLAAMGSFHKQQTKLVLDPPLAAPDEHAQWVAADQRFQAALDQAIADGRERIAAVQATVQAGRAVRANMAEP